MVRDRDNEPMPPNACLVCGNRKWQKKAWSKGKNNREMVILMTEKGSCGNDITLKETWERRLSKIKCEHYDVVIAKVLEAHPDG